MAWQITAPSPAMRVASHGGTRPPCSGRSALPVRRAMVQNPNRASQRNRDGTKRRFRKSHAVPRFCAGAAGDHRLVRDASWSRWPGGSLLLARDLLALLARLGKADGDGLLAALHL